MPDLADRGLRVQLTGGKFSHHSVHWNRASVTPSLQAANNLCVLPSDDVSRDRTLIGMVTVLQRVRSISVSILRWHRAGDDVLSLPSHAQKRPRTGA